jgi:hypothetical protein
MCLLGGILHLLGYIIVDSRVMAIGYLFLSFTAYTLFSIALAHINNIYTKNKIGNLCVFIFWTYVAECFIYVGKLIFNQNIWFPYVSYFIFLILSLVVGLT